MRDLVLQPSLGIEAAVLQHKRDLGFAEREIELAPQLGLFLVLDEQQAREAVVHLPRDVAVRVRVVEVHRGAVLHPEGVLEGFPGLGQYEAVAVVPRIGAQPMPVDDGRLVELVHHAQAHLLAAVHEQRRIEKALAARLGRVGEVGRALSGQQLDLGARYTQFPELGYRYYAVESARAWKPQRIGKHCRFAFDRGCFSGDVGAARLGERGAAHVGGAKSGGAAEKLPTADGHLRFSSSRGGGGR